MTIYGDAVLTEACVNCYLTVLHLVLTQFVCQNNALWPQELVWTMFQNDWMTIKFLEQAQNKNNSEKALLCSTLSAKDYKYINRRNVLN